MSAIDVSGVRKSFDGTEVLHGIDLEIPEGAFTAILGPSGCGKTTLLRLIAGFAAPDAGTIRLGGAQVSGPGRFVPPERRDLGYLAQEGALFPHLSIERNITFGLRRRERVGHSRVRELMDLVSLDHAKLPMFPHELSGGQQQRVALARALARRPRVVLLDEPFAALDADLRAGTRSLVKEVLTAEGVTTVLVTHDQAEALSLADQVAVIHSGRVRQVGTAREVYETPVDLTTATITGETVLLAGESDGVLVRCELGTAPSSGPAAARVGPVTVLLRPENLQLVDSDDDGLPVRTVAVEYFGHDSLVTVTLGRPHVRRPADVRGDDPGRDGIATPAPRRGPELPGVTVRRVGRHPWTRRVT